MGYVQLSVVLLVIFLFELALSSSLCPKDQSISLVKFTETFTIDTFASLKSKTSSWNMSTDCCLWDGVKCDEMTGHVIELDLNNCGLVGKADSNSTLFELSHLQKLDLSWNNFSNSHISPNFGRFSSSTYLDLSHSYFSGQIPSEISHLSKLQSLRLYGADLRLVADDFKLLLQNLTELRELDLTAVNISSTIPPNISSHLTILRLEQTGLYGIILESTFQLPNLKKVDLSNNYQLSGYLHESLGYLTSLLDLSLRDCNMLGPIPESLSNLTRIEYLILGDNSLNGTIPSLIFSLPSLIGLDLSDNYFSGQLENNFKSNSLAQIFLERNQLRGHLPKSIQNLVYLNSLDLSSNNFSGNADVSLFSNLKNLRNLDLSYNRISLTNSRKNS
nr:receptor-like protein Cf-9 [Nicotiana tomentosiformis]